MRHTFFSCLIRCANMKWIRWVLLKIQSGHDFVHRRTDGQTDGRTDGQTDKVILVYPPFNFVEVGGITNIAYDCVSFCSLMVNHKLYINSNRNILSGMLVLFFSSFLSATLGLNLAINLWYSMLHGHKNDTDVTQWICALQILEPTQGAICHTSASLLVVMIWCYLCFLNSLWPSDTI